VDLLVTIAVDHISHNTRSTKLNAEVDQAEADNDWYFPRILSVGRLTPSKEPSCCEEKICNHDRETELRFCNGVIRRYITSRFDIGNSPNVPLFIFDILRTRPSIKGPATAVPSNEATKADKFVNPTAVTEKLYGGAENICERVIEMPTSHEMQVVNKIVDQITTGDASMLNRRNSVLRNPT